MPRTWGKEWEPRSRSRRGAAPRLQRAPGKRHFLRRWRAKVMVTVVLGVGWAGEGRMPSSWPAQVSRGFILENRLVGLFGPLGPLSPQPGDFAKNLAWGPAAPSSLPWFLPISGLWTCHFFLLAAATLSLTHPLRARGISFSQPQNVCVTSSLQAWKARGAEPLSVLFTAAPGP